MKNLFLILFLTITQSIFCQREANIWYFGKNAGLDFNSGEPVALASGKLNTYEGCATISTVKGRLLFYTDGVTIWDSAHTIMPNGTNLKGHNSTTQSALIVPIPDSSHLFYIFTVGNNDGALTPKGCTYSVLNMKLNSGKGDIVSNKKNIHFFNSENEKITAVKHKNDKDYWLILTKGKDSLYTWHITSSGISNKPVISKSINSNPLLGYIKISPDRKKIASANFAGDSIMIGDFDNSTGKITNIFGVYSSSAYGLEFSPESNYIYIGEYGNKKIYQFNAKANSKNEFIASKKLIGNSFSYPLGSLQLAPDGKIYISTHGSKYLDVIHAPDSNGSSSRLQKNYIFLKGSAELGLPNFIQSYFERDFYYSTNCFNYFVSFNISNTYKIDSVKWNFGDTSTRNNNESKKITEVSHTYSKPGYYTTRLLVYFKNKVDTIYHKFYINNYKFSIGNDTTICNKFKLTLNPKTDYLNYKWNTGKNSKTVNVNSKGIYILTVTDSLGCKSSDTIVIKNPIISADFSISDSIQCVTSNSFEFKETTSYKDDSKKLSAFYFFDSNSSDTIIRRSFPNEGKYTVLLMTESKEGCQDSKIKTIEVRPKTKADFKTSDVCETDSVSFINQSKNAEAYNWKFGDGEYSSKTSPKHLYKINGVSLTFNVTFVSLLSGGCSDSVVNVVTVNANPISDFTYSLSGIKIDLKANQANNTKYLWKYGKSDSSVTSNPNSSHTYSVFPNPNTVCLKATNAAGCVSETCKQISTTSISYTKPSGFKIYPNPNTGNFTVEIENPEKDISVEVYNSMGEMVEKVKMLEKVTKINLEVAAGIYLVKVKNGNEVFIQKISVVK